MSGDVKQCRVAKGASKGPVQGPAQGGVVLNGYHSLEEVKRSPGYPSQERLSKGPVAVIECVQEIPCNPCEAACPQKAVTVGQPITNLPALDGEKCIGCGLCIPKCPGLAIFLIDMTHSDKEASLAFPYEYLPLPAPGDTVEAVDRAGKPVCKAKVLKVVNIARNDRTPVVTIAVPKEYAEKVRSIARKRGDKSIG